MLEESSEHTLVGVVCQPDRPSGRDLNPRPPAIKTEALERGIPVFQPQRIREPAFLETLASLAPDLMVVVAYGQILPRSVLFLPPLGCINLHASLLPRHRGASPIHRAIAEGDEITGITVIHMDEGLDTGAILLADATPIGPDETAGQLHDRLAKVAADSLSKALDLLASGSAPRIPQDNALATLTGKLSKEDGCIDWSRPAPNLARHVRAMSPWPGAFTRFRSGTATLKVHSAFATEESGEPGIVLASGPKGLVVAAGKGSLNLQSVQLEGRKRLSIAEFLRGYPVAVGERFEGKPTA